MSSGQVHNTLPKQGRSYSFSNSQRLNSKNKEGTPPALSPPPPSINSKFGFIKNHINVFSNSKRYLEALSFLLEKQFFLNHFYFPFNLGNRNRHERGSVSTIVPPSKDLANQLDQTLASSRGGQAHQVWL